MDPLKPVGMVGLCRSMNQKSLWVNLLGVIWTGAFRQTYPPLKVRNRTLFHRKDEVHRQARVLEEIFL
jgi:hypothetical protein